MSKHPLCPVTCPLYHTESNYVPPDMGDGPSLVVHMGEAPGVDEDRELRPFVGNAGRLRDAILAMARLSHPPTANIVNCRPPDNKLRGETYEAGAVAACRVHRDAFIAATNPTYIVALGDVALYDLTGRSGITDLRGYEFPSLGYDNVKVIGTFHPSHLLRSRKEARGMAKGRAGMSLVQAVIFDMKLAPARGPLIKLRGHPNATATDLLDFFGRDPFYIVDIETPRSAGLTKDENTEDPSYTIVRVSLDNGRYAISFPWQEPYISILKPAFTRNVDWVFWNWEYDVPRLQHNGMAFGGRIVDAMWLFALLFPDLPRGLDNVAPYYVNVAEWKSKAASDPAYYSAMDSFVTRHCYVGIRNHLAKEGMTKLAEDRTSLLQILRAMGTRGVRIDIDRLGAFRSKLNGMLCDITDTIHRDGLWPAAMQQYHPENGYIRPPKVTNGLIQREFLDADGKPVIRWCRPIPFNPLSPIDIKDYASLKVHKLTSTGKPLVSTEEKYLAVMLNRYKDPLYKLTIEYRGVNKLKGTYTEWPLGSDGRVHTRYTCRPATGRLSSIHPNLQNIPHDEDDPLAMEFRSLLVASEKRDDCPFLHPDYHPTCNGHTLGRADYSGIEAVLTGWFAQDPSYIALAKLGVHAYATARYLDILVPPDNPGPTLAHVKATHKAIYTKLKKCNHGINYGEGPDKMFTENPGLFESRGEARRFHRFIKSLFATVTDWQEATVRRAMKEHVLYNPFRRRRWFWDPTEDGPAAIAFLPQSTAADILIAAMLHIAACEPRLAHFMVMQIHDELVFDLPVETASNDMLEVMSIMEKPVPELNNLSIGTAVTISPSLGVA